MKPMRALTIVAILTCFAVCTTSCAFTDGEPWGWVEATVAVGPVDSSSKLFITRQATGIEVVRLYSAASGGGVVDFDPANPPPGYTLCHADHCHADDGRLVSYEEIRGSGAASQGPSLASASRVSTVLEGGTPLDTRLKIVDEATLSLAEVELSSMQLSGRITIDEQDYPITIALPVAGLRIEGEIYLTVDRASPHEQDLLLALELPMDLFEGVDTTTLRIGADETVLITNTSNPQIAQSLAQRLRDEARLVMVE